MLIHNIKISILTNNKLASEYHSLLSMLPVFYLYIRMYLPFILRRTEQKTHVLYTPYCYQYVRHSLVF
jgi:hypothetical protein